MNKAFLLLLLATLISFYEAAGGSQYPPMRQDAPANQRPSLNQALQAAIEDFLEHDMGGWTCTFLVEGSPCNCTFFASRYQTADRLAVNHLFSVHMRHLAN
ncbi:hypothetical protein EBZ39_12700 [bacterium]|nr:hypothetical protein [bacterium]